MRLRDLTYLYALDFLEQKLSKRFSKKKAWLLSMLLVPMLCGAIIGYIPVSLLGITYGTLIVTAFPLYLLISVFVRIKYKGT